MRTPSVKLTYLAARADAEPARVALWLAGIPFKDDAISPRDWPRLRPAVPFARLPLLNVNGCHSLVSPVAVLHYAGSLAGLYPTSNHFQSALIDQIVSAVADILDALFDAAPDSPPALAHDRADSDADMSPASSTPDLSAEIISALDVCQPPALDACRPRAPALHHAALPACFLDMPDTAFISPFSPPVQLPCQPQPLYFSPAVAVAAVAAALDPPAVRGPVPTDRMLVSADRFGAAPLHAPRLATPPAVSSPDICSPARSASTRSEQSAAHDHSTHNDGGDRGSATLAEMLAHLEHAVATQSQIGGVPEKWAIGSAMSIADLSIYVLVAAIQKGVVSFVSTKAVDPYPHLLRIHAAVRRLPRIAQCEDGGCTAKAPA
ncbi:hypothetical protein HK105_200183 [Polyrhizophydium stewartii]|uniref:GST N-terminal domain-containing protein n=1 Tax=Polyrhizophydium stewartii TaxID=2732419 RepID=A0ABR4NKR9_9FUNG